ncbi:hypothetical protein ACFFMP_09705 [Pseudoroseomonas cervicalis]
MPARPLTEGDLGREIQRLDAPPGGDQAGAGGRQPDRRIGGGAGDPGLQPGGAGEFRAQPLQLRQVQHGVQLQHLPSRAAGLQPRALAAHIEGVDAEDRAAVIRLRRRAERAGERLGRREALRAQRGLDAFAVFHGGGQGQRLPAEAGRDEVAQHGGRGEPRLGLQPGQAALGGDLAGAGGEAQRSQLRLAAGRQPGIDGEVDGAHRLRRQRGGGVQMPPQGQRAAARGVECQPPLGVEAGLAAEIGAGAQAGAAGRPVQRQAQLGRRGGDAERGGQHAARRLGHAEIGLQRRLRVEGEVEIKPPLRLQPLHAELRLQRGGDQAGLALGREGEGGGGAMLLDGGRDQLARDLDAGDGQFFQAQRHGQVRQGRDRPALGGRRLRRRRVGVALRQAQQGDAGGFQRLDAQLAAEQGAQVEVEPRLVHLQPDALGIGHAQPGEARGAGDRAVQPLDGEARHEALRQIGDQPLPRRGVGPRQHAAQQ